MGRIVQTTLGLCLFFAGFGATVAFGVFAFIGVPIAILGLGVFSAGFDSI